jgi:hypothetical protein
MLFAFFDGSVMFFTLLGGNECFVVISKEGVVLECPVAIVAISSLHENGGLFDFGVFNSFGMVAVLLPRILVVV